MIAKKLQVFVSSTYTDLQLERQSAVEAILAAGHIPAGMELFAAGDRSQLQTIQRWIDDSDVFLLILGGRYGSIDTESGKSYIHLEYDYAISKNKPVFAVVINGEHLKKKAREAEDPRAVIEQEHYQEWRNFQERVLQKMVRFWSDPRDIKLAILEALSDFGRRSDLEGWVPASQGANAAALAEEIARLSKENLVLRRKIEELSIQIRNDKLSPSEFGHVYKSLAAETDCLDGLWEDELSKLKELAELFGDPMPSLIHAVWVLQEGMTGTFTSKEGKNVNLNIFSRLADYGLVKISKEFRAGSFKWSCEITEFGKAFITRLVIEKDSDQARKYIQVTDEDD